MGKLQKVSLREKIKSLMYDHLKKSNGLIMGQCLTAVGWVGGTLPELYEDDGMVELSMADVAGGGFAVGAALAGRKPVYIIRYQGFNWFNAPIILNYASKSKEMWNIPCSMFIRSIGMEGGVGPVAGSSHHSIYYRMPGVRIFAPVTPNEFHHAYKEYMQSDDVFYISEHRKSWDNDKELETINYKNPDITLLPISITRFEALLASKELYKQGIKVNVHHLFEIKPLKIVPEAIKSIKNSKLGGLILDNDFSNGAAKSIAYEFMMMSKKDIHVLGLEDRTAGFYHQVDNLPPDSNKIINKVLGLLK